MNDFKNRSPYIELCLCRRCASVYYDDPTYWIERAEIFQDELYMCGRRIRFLSLLIYPFKSLQALIFQGFWRFFHFCCHAGNLRIFP